MSLIEVVVFIVVFGIGIAGILTLYSQLTKASVDPLVRKQALALASSLLEEIELHAFTYCDPDDPLVYTATQSLDCTTAEGIGVEGAETRYGNTGPLFLRYDNASDYQGFSMAGAGILNVAGTAVAGLADYAVLVSIANIDIVSAPPELPNVTDANDALRITVTATHNPSGKAVSLQGYRLRYAPNSP